MPTIDMKAHRPGQEFWTSGSKLYVADGEGVIRDVDHTDVQELLSLGCTPAEQISQSSISGPGPGIQSERAAEARRRFTQENQSDQRTHGRLMNEGTGTAGGMPPGEGMEPRGMPTNVPPEAIGEQRTIQTPSPGREGDDVNRVAGFSTTQAPAHDLATGVDRNELRQANTAASTEPAQEDIQDVHRSADMGGDEQRQKEEQQQEQRRLEQENEQEQERRRQQEQEEKNQNQNQETDSKDGQKPDQRSGSRRNR